MSTSNSKWWRSVTLSSHYSHVVLVFLLLILNRQMPTGIAQIQYTLFFYISNTFFHLSLRVASFFHEFRMLRCCLGVAECLGVALLYWMLRCCFIILRHILYLLYFPCLSLGQFMSYHCDLFFILLLNFCLLFCQIQPRVNYTCVIKKPLPKQNQ